MTDLRDDVDMTPMVDVVFLLLIFFMVTAAFHIQKSIEIPQPDTSQAAESATIDELADDALVVRVDGDNIYWIGGPAWHEEKEAPNPVDMLIKLREARAAARQAAAGSANVLLVLAAGDATHEKVVAALDAGSELGMEDVRLATLEDEEL
jgi:biopolymer transport protein ExbD